MRPFYDRHSPEIVERARKLCQSPSALERTVGADILNQVIQAIRDTDNEEMLGSLTEINHDLLAMLEVEQDAEVLGSIIAALGHLLHVNQYQSDIVTVLSKWQHHPAAEVRHAVTGALWGTTDERAVEMLLGLMVDDDADVRDWATFGLGSVREEDTPDIREALANRLDDPNAIVAGEALVGLARRGDQRAVNSLLNMQPFTAEDEHTLEYEALVKAGISTGDPRLLPLLEPVYQAKLLAKDDAIPHDLALAYDACHRGTPADREDKW